MNNPQQEKEEWVEKFKETKFAKGGSLSFECSDYEGMYTDMIDFISHLLSTQHEQMEKHWYKAIDILYCEKCGEFITQDQGKELRLKLETLGKEI